MGQPTYFHITKHWGLQFAYLLTFRFSLYTTKIVERISYLVAGIGFWPLVNHSQLVVVVVVDDNVSEAAPAADEGNQHADEDEGSAQEDQPEDKAQQAKDDVTNPFIQPILDGLALATVILAMDCSDSH